MSTSPQPQLTVTELETLATMLRSAQHHMVKAPHAWPYPLLNDAADDMVRGFHDLQTDPWRELITL